MTTVQYKVLDGDLKSPYFGTEYKLGRWYTEPRVGEMGESGCVRGLYAGPVESLLYRGVWRQRERVYRCECDGRRIEHGPLKVAWERMRVLAPMTDAQVRALARRHHARLGYLLEECLYPVAPLLVERGRVTDREVELLRQWASACDSVGDSVGASVWDSVRDRVLNSVRASVRASVWDSVGASVWDSVRDSVLNRVRASVGDSVWASVRDSVRGYVGSLFPRVETWKYIDHAPGVYPFQAGADLWRAGLVPAFDGNRWRLHSGHDAAVVWEGEP